jgi:hypothetical protein
MKTNKATKTPDKYPRDVAISIGPETVKKMEVLIFISFKNDTKMQQNL